MSGTNDFQPVAAAGGANVVTQAEYLALTSLLADGLTSGIVNSAQINKMIRQATFVAAAVAQLVANSGANATDDGNMAGFVAKLQQTMGASVVGDTRNLRAAVANTHVVNHAGKTLALVESSLPYEITNDLETVGAYDFGGKLVDSMTAHPKICPTTGELHFFGYGSIFEPYVTYHRADAGGDLIINRPVDVKAHTMMHDFAMTAGHVIFMDLPVVFDLDVAIKGDGDMPFRWSDTYGARFGVLRRDDPDAPIRWFDIDPCYVFHVANAHDDGDSIVLQAVRYPELWRNDGGFDIDGVLWEWRIDLTSGKVRERQLDDAGVEFPRIDDRLAGLPARYSVSVAGNAWIRYDLTTGAGIRHELGTGGPGEAVFVPGAGSADESNGYYLGYVYNPERDGSDLVILDASDFGGKPVATIALPQRVPYGFHGNWIGA